MAELAPPAVSADVVGAAFWALLSTAGAQDGHGAEGGGTGSAKPESGPSFPKIYSPPTGFNVYSQVGLPGRSSTLAVSFAPTRPAQSAAGALHNGRS